MTSTYSYTFYFSDIHPCIHEVTELEEQVDEQDWVCRLEKDSHGRYPRCPWFGAGVFDVGQNIIFFLSVILSCYSLRYPSQELSNPDCGDVSLLIFTLSFSLTESLHWKNTKTATPTYYVVYRSVLRFCIKKKSDWAANKNAFCHELVLLFCYVGIPVLLSASVCDIWCSFVNRQSWWFPIGMGGSSMVWRIYL